MVVIAHERAVLSYIPWATTANAAPDDPDLTGPSCAQFTACGRSGQVPHHRFALPERRGL